MADRDAEAAARAQPEGELAHGLAVAGFFSLPALNVAYEAAGEFGGLPLYRELGDGGGGIYWHAGTSKWNLHTEYTEEKAKGAEELPSAAAAAIDAMIAEHAPAGATPLERARAIGAAGLWAETWDGGATWHFEGDKKRALPAA